MTRPTGDVGLPVIELRIDVAHHLQHHASLHLLGLGVEGQVVRIVAVHAAGAGRESNVLHREFDVLSSEHFEIGSTDNSGPSRRERRHLTAAISPPRAPPPGGSRRHRESAGSPGQIVDNYRNLLVSQIRTCLLRRSCSGRRSLRATDRAPSERSPCDLLLLHVHEIFLVLQAVIIDQFAVQNERLL